MRVLVRLVGFIVLAAAFVALVVDGTRSIAGHAVLMTSAGKMAASLAPATHERLQAAVAASAPLKAAANGVLDLPAWLLGGIVGAALLALARKRREPPGRR